MGASRKVVLACVGAVRGELEAGQQCRSLRIDIARTSSASLEAARSFANLVGGFSIWSKN